MIALILLKLTFSLEYLPIFGGSEVPGYYFANIKIGTPPVSRILMIDIGSELTSLACISCISCGKHINSYYDYKASRSSHILKKNINGTEALLNYSLSYVDDSNISGFLLRDNIKLDLINNPIAIRVTLGCNAFETGLFDKLQADGVLGLAPSNSQYYSLMNSLFSSGYIDKKVFSICLGEFDGFITFGGINETLNQSPMPSTQYYQSNLYQFSLSQISLNASLNENLLSKEELFTLSSGSSISYLRPGLFQKFVSVFKEFCKDPTKCLDRPIEIMDYRNLCFEALQKGNFSYSSYPVLKLSHLDFRIEWEPEAYMVRIRGSRPGVFCVGILESPIENINVFGTNFFKNKQIVFDNEKLELKISRSLCSPSFMSSAHAVYLNHPDTNISEILTYVYLFSMNLLLIFAYFLSVYSLSKPEPNN